jgi:hypothetical protein
MKLWDPYPRDYWLERWKNMMCCKIITVGPRCKTPDGYVTCYLCRYGIGGDLI